MNKYTFLNIFLVLKHISDPKIQDGRQIWMENPFFLGETEFDPLAGWYECNS